MKGGREEGMEGRREGGMEGGRRQTEAHKGPEVWKKTLGKWS